LVEEIEQEGKKYFVCSVCKFAYDKKDTAEQCENWCTTHGACSLEITGKGVGLLKNKSVELFNKKEVVG
jgi:cobalamin biosynthesis protein CbiD